MGGIAGFRVSGFGLSVHEGTINLIPRYSPYTTPKAPYKGPSFNPLRVEGHPRSSLSTESEGLSPVRAILAVPLPERSLGVLLSMSSVPPGVCFSYSFLGFRV